MKFYKRRSTTNRLLFLLVNPQPLVEVLAIDSAFGSTYILKASAGSFVATINDPTTKEVILSSGSLSVSYSPINLTKYDSEAITTITLLPAAGWSYFDVSSISIISDERCVFRNQSVAVGNQIAYETSTTQGETVYISSNGYVTLTGTTGKGTFNYRIFNGTSWSSPLSFELNPDIIISVVDTDDQITVGQTPANVSGTNVVFADAAQVRYPGGVVLYMQNYSPGASATFTVPNLTDFFSSGMPLGSVTFDLLRAS